MPLKRYIFLFILGTLWAVPVHAQKGIKPVKPVPQTVLAPEEISRILQQRVETSFEKVNVAQKSCPLTQKILPEFSYSSLSPNIKQPEKLYPQMASLLHTPQQWNSYILANNNRRITAELFRKEQLLQYLQNHLTDLSKNQHIVSLPRARQMEALAQQIPPDTQYLLLGEGHMEFISDYVAALLPRIRDNNPGREIILFSEALHENSRQWLAYIFSPHEAAFSVARDENMSIVGLEPRFVAKNSRPSFRNNDLNLTTEFWTSLEGMALRNQYWLEIIRRLRQEHPHALFIIYAGARHVAYNAPYSLGTCLAREKTFTVLLLPQALLNEEYKLVFGESLLANALFANRPEANKHYGLLYVSPYDYFSITNGIQVQPFITFDKPQALEVGFDARLFLK